MLILELLVFSLITAISPVSSDDEHHPRTKRDTNHAPPHVEEIDPKFWETKAQTILQRHLSERINTNIAKNVIFFLGDGLSLPTIAASRTYLGQLQGNSGEESTLYFENFPYTGLSRTYCVDAQVADSACSATAYLGGAKANYATIGVSAAVSRSDCLASGNASNHVLSVAHWAQQAGKATGFVTTTRVTHASPAGVYAHVADRTWEDDTAIKGGGQSAETCPDIAQQLILGPTGSKLNVIMGGGRRHFYPDTFKDVRGVQGKRRDKKNLVELWKRSKQGQNASHSFVTNRKELLAASPYIDYLLGLFSASHLSYHLENNKNEPTLEEMTVAAINVLKKNKNGFFLFVEGGRIDHAHHDNMAKRSLDETVEFSKAVAAADALTSAQDTLIVVTSDHAHTMSFSGYAPRGGSILGVAGEGADGLPYSTLSYSNGPTGNKRQDLRTLNMVENTFKFPAMTPLKSETHGGDDVAVFATGPYAHLFTGSFEQNYIPHALGYAACIGRGLHACKSYYIT